MIKKLTNKIKSFFNGTYDEALIKREQVNRINNAMLEKEKQELYFSEEYMRYLNAKQVYFVEGSREEDRVANEWVIENFDVIDKDFKWKGCELLRSRGEQKIKVDVLKYHDPSAFVEGLEDEISCEYDILALAENAKDFKDRGSAFLHYSGEQTADGYYIFTYFELEPRIDGIGFEDVVKFYKAHLNNGESAIRFSRRSIYEEEYDADEKFSVDAQNLMDEVRNKISELRVMGISEMMLRSLIGEEKKLSRLIVTRDYRILLPDYNGMEIKIAPLPKAVFLLFLRHEEGILFKELIDYREELRLIYEDITHRACIDSVNRSVDAICDPTNNAINEKCARVREAFVKSFDESLAEHYFITGSRGEAKRIVLDRSMVEWE